MWSNIKFLGVWDTVSALGLPIESLDMVVNWFRVFRHRFHNFKLSEAVENAYHALAIDDIRKTFHPKIWDKEISDKQKMKQVWFCGVHTDVGGGYEEQGLSDISLMWMTEMAKQNGLLIYKDHKVPVNQNIEDVMHDSASGFPGSLFRKKERFWEEKIKGRLVIHESVLERKLNRHNEPDPPYKPWVLDLDHDIEPWNRDFNERE
jgi:hypothetical protein